MRHCRTGEFPIFLLTPQFPDAAGASRWRRVWQELGFERFPITGQLC
jgi:hypothetical protein